MDNVIKLTGRIDTTNAGEWEQSIFSQLGTQKDIIFDAAGLSYISSAGLRVLMKVIKQTGGEVKVINVSRDVYDILDTTGFVQLMKVEKQMRELSVEGCEVIGQGFCGTVYRIDPETIVKVYSAPDSLPMIKNEQRLAKRAFVKGVPTAISYDIVRVGDSYGSVFELLNARSFNDHLINEPRRFDELLKQYVDFLKVVHSAEMDAGTMPMAKKMFMGYLDCIASSGDYLTGGQISRLKELFSALPDDLHMVHGDFQMKNVMIVNGEPMLIDMDTVATGQPLFDLQALYVTYVLFSEDDPDNLKSFLGIPNEWGGRIWQSILSNYFNTADEHRLSLIQDKISLAASVRFLYLLVSTDLKEGKLGEKRVRRAQAHINDLLEKVDDLFVR